VFLHVTCLRLAKLILTRSWKVTAYRVSQPPTTSFSHFLLEQDDQNRHERTSQFYYKTRKLPINLDRRDYRVTHAPRHRALCSEIAAKPPPPPELEALLSRSPRTSSEMVKPAGPGVYSATYSNVCLRFNCLVQWAQRLIVLRSLSTNTSLAKD